MSQNERLGVILLFLVFVYLDFVANIEKENELSRLSSLQQSKADLKQWPLKIVFLLHCFFT